MKATIFISAILIAAAIDKSLVFDNAVMLAIITTILLTGDIVSFMLKPIDVSYASKTN